MALRNGDPGRGEVVVKNACAVVLPAGASAVQHDAPMLAWYPTWKGPQDFPAAIVYV